MTEKLLRLVRALVAVIGVLSGVLLVASVALNFANVVGRYFFNASIPWAEEAMLFLMVGCVFLGNGVVAWSGRQIRMDVVVAHAAAARCARRSICSPSSSSSRPRSPSSSSPGR